MKINKPQSSRRKFLKKTFYTLSGTLALQLPFPFIKRVYAGDKNPRRGLGNLFLKMKSLF